MEYDDKIRSLDGVVVSLRDMGNGKSRLFFDDVKGSEASVPTSWRHTCFYTFSPELENGQLEEMKLTDADFQGIGVMIVARLLALNSGAEKE